MSESSPFPLAGDVVGCDSSALASPPVSWLVLAGDMKVKLNPPGADLGVDTSSIGEARGEKGSGSSSLSSASPCDVPVGFLERVSLRKRSSTVGLGLGLSEGCTRGGERGA